MNEVVNIGIQSKLQFMKQVQTEVWNVELAKDDYELLKDVLHELSICVGMSYRLENSASSRSPPRPPQRNATPSGHCRQSEKPDRLWASSHADKFKRRFCTVPFLERMKPQVMH
jgi:hypothetical protein